MAALKIPERYKPGFVVLGGLTDAAFNEFLLAAKRAPTPFTTTRELSAWLGSEVGSVPNGELVKLVESVTSFYRLRSRAGITTSRLANDLADGARESIRNLKISEGVDLSARLAELLALDAFSIVSLKAKELQSEAERVFVEARVMSDIRPVFGEKLNEIQSMFIAHTLKIVAHEGPAHKELYMALDEDDIASLINTLERAQEKARNLKELLASKGLKAIELSSKDQTL